MSAANFQAVLDDSLADPDGAAIAKLIDDLRAACGPVVANQLVTETQAFVATFPTATTAERRWMTADALTRFYGEHA